LPAAYIVSVGALTVRTRIAGACARIRSGSVRRSVAQVAGIPASIRTRPVCRRVAQVAGIRARSARDGCASVTRAGRPGAQSLLLSRVRLPRGHGIAAAGPAILIRGRLVRVGSATAVLRIVLPVAVPIPIHIVDVVPIHVYIRLVIMANVIVIDVYINGGSAVAPPATVAPAAAVV
jgi:hypothetical protein